MYVDIVCFHAINDGSKEGHFQRYDVDGVGVVSRIVPQKSVCPSSVGSAVLHMMCASASEPRYAVPYMSVQQVLKSLFNVGSVYVCDTHTCLQFSYNNRNIDSWHILGVRRHNAQNQNF